ncbi:hypothetical protein [Azospirillum argentinense]|uniref:Uncharacterized protein n=1 Tax=Azospirillum brasilense TaxID=192 RepID=A0A4D8QB65_AZOBR|nr:hypothetical protein [Azospirillum argentinense]QCO07558.1 hypothetical protein D3867_37375 [Azospirillum argentinense]
MQRFGAALTDRLAGQRSLHVTLHNSKVGVTLTRQDEEGARYDISSYSDDTGCTYAWSCMSKTRVTAFLRAWLREGEEAAA